MLGRAILLIFATVLTACGGSGATSQPPSPPTSQSAALSVHLTQAGGTIVFPIVDGYGGTFLASPNNAVSGTVASLKTTTAPSASLLPTQPPPGNMLASFEFTLNENVTFLHWHRLLTTITIPASIVTAGHTFSEYGYDLTNAVGEGLNPGTVEGTTIVFGDGFGPVTLLANHSYLMVLAVQ